MEMRVMLELLAPGMEHRQTAELGPKTLGVAADVQKALGHGMKEEGIEHAGILKDEGTEFLRQGGNHMDVRCVQDFSLSIGEPSGLGRPVTFWATAVPARIIRWLLVLAAVALGQVSAEGGGAAQLDGTQGAMLRTAQSVPIALQEGLAMLAHHIGHFEPRATHDGCSR
jgi:hypothetical protein